MKKISYWLTDSDLHAIKPWFGVALAALLFWLLKDGQISVRAFCVLLPVAGLLHKMTRPTQTEGTSLDGMSEHEIRERYVL